MSAHPYGAIAEQRARIRALARDLFDLGDAFSKTGNTTVAVHLCEVASDLLQAEKAIEAAAAAWTTREVKAAEASFAATFKAVLAGMGVNPDTVIAPAET